MACLLLLPRRWCMVEIKALARGGNEDVMVGNLSYLYLCLPTPNVNVLIVVLCLYTTTVCLSVSVRWLP